jgi:RND superfamily putative drug exporter
VKRLVVAATVVAVLYVYLALLSPRVFDVLIYEESKLMPPDIEPKVVDAILNKTQSGGLKPLPVVIFGPGVRRRRETSLGCSPTSPQLGLS